MPRKDQNITKPKINPDTQHINTLIESVKAAGTAQYGDLKKDLGGVTGMVQKLDTRLAALEEDKIRRDAIEVYKKEHPEVAQKVFDTGQAAYNDTSTGSIAVNKELLKAIGLLVIALGAVVMGWVATKKG